MLTITFVKYIWFSENAALSDFDLIAQSSKSKIVVVVRVFLYVCAVCVVNVKLKNEEEKWTHSTQ